MKLLRILATAVLSLGVAQASDFVGAYALISKVTLEPSAAKPERIRIEGVFAMSKPNDMNYYLTPQRGMLYFSLPSARSEQALAEWRDLLSVAGTGKVVSVGNRSQFMSLPVLGGRQGSAGAVSAWIGRHGEPIHRVRAHQSFAGVQVSHGDHDVGQALGLRAARGRAC